MHTDSDNYDHFKRDQLTHNYFFSSSKNNFRVWGSSQQKHSLSPETVCAESQGLFITAQKNSHAHTDMKTKICARQTFFVAKSASASEQRCLTATGRAQEGCGGREGGRQDDVRHRAVGPN